ncbi:nuclear transport factor 2 family protein [Chryseobacterium flavum]|uniref:nuclear transport factor 2 family protein n=1 Tax=Chryseobacterium flavum TaxID=415851 RepID=UPI0028ACF3E7|nr:nuclear transport factor 2 family protein [Chryseobacterium flavum]
MKKIAVIFLLITGLCFSQQNQEIEKPIRTLFFAMKTADSVVLKSVFAENAIMQTVTKEGIVKNNDIQGFVSSVSKFAKGDLDEKIIIEAVHTDGNLATVFTPYSFYFKGKLLHCGANSFQLVKQNNDWKIQYIIDTRRKENCSEIK